MLDYLQPRDGPVIDGLESLEVVYAKDQPEYVPLRTLSGEEGMSAISRWTPTKEQRISIFNGADIMLEVYHFRQPLSPVRVAILIEDQGDTSSV
jgi:hypothetical protein